MTLSDDDKNALEEILMQEGDCLDGHDLCRRCPFKSECLSKFLHMRNPSTGHRLSNALDALADEALVSDNDSVEDKKKQ
jgi:hypothetical protein